jgi:acetyltransferase-like isoleucine patch superfamily enzyme
MPGIRAARAAVAPGAKVAESALLVADSVSVGSDVVIEDGVEIVGDRIDIGEGSRIGRDTRIVSPDVRVGAGTTIAGSCRVAVNERFHVGPSSQIGERLRATAESIVIGERLWMTDDVVIGGGGARTDGAVLRLGDRVAVMDRCFINVCREIVIGDETALSIGVTLLTHSTWHRVLDGGSAIFAPIRIGRDTIAFINAVVAPGVTIGDHVTIAANALVLTDMPDGCMAVGNPARPVRRPSDYPYAVTAEHKDTIIREALRDYAAELRVKGVRADLASADVLVANGNDFQEVIRYVAYDSSGSGQSPRATITLSCRKLEAGERARCHFDLSERHMDGVASDLSEDFRDFLRRRTIRIFTDRPFRSLPQANVARLIDRLAASDRR